ncbi:hypothetical protein BJY01DRAFT_256496 [Aspergillus pseudoustus]|uniref:Cupin type-2 domain-containing protein n=1 Tax=Aspergillus pseudoustus TaxID=1810923 RepID=A0ABR4IBH8_9EURO
MNSFPLVRRIVTGHDERGNAIIDSDSALTSFRPQDLLGPSNQISDEAEDRAKDARFVVLWRTDAFPAPLQGPWTDYNNKPLPLNDPTGTIARIVDMPPGLSSPFHRTVSLDVGVVLVGEVVLELDNAVEATVRQGETIIQRGTIHAWHNRGERMARVLFVLVPGQKIEIGGNIIPPTKLGVN